MVNFIIIEYNIWHDFVSGCGQVLDPNLWNRQGCLGSLQLVMMEKLHYLASAIVTLVFLQVLFILEFSFLTKRIIIVFLIFLVVWNYCLYTSFLSCQRRKKPFKLQDILIWACQTIKVNPKKNFIKTQPKCHTYRY